jgi:hypothetical protein
MSIETREVRCAGCGSLLAKLTDGALTIQRNDLQATFDGDLRAAIVCYRARCRKLNVLRVRSSSGDSDRNPQPPPR